MPEDTEIERKWLVNPNRIPYNLENLEYNDLEQAYITFSPVIRIRCINGGEENYITIKIENSNGLSRTEYEHPISFEDYSRLLQQCRGNVISKRRYLIRKKSGLLEELDVFNGSLNGLCLLEIEFPDIETASAYPTPEWVECDVTTDYRYRNSTLAEEGYNFP